jgi:hypothetical protein
VSWRGRLCRGGASRLLSDPESEESGVELVVILDAAQEDVLQEATEALRRAHLKHYEALGPEGTRNRFRDLFTLVLECVTQRTLVPISQYAQQVAEQRFAAGFDIAEVLTAFNVLEEAIWHVVIARLATQDLLESAGLIGTVLGAGKDALASTWVSLATRQHVTSLDLSALFHGAGN